MGGVFDNGAVPGESDPAYLTAAGVGATLTGPWRFFASYDIGFPLTPQYKSSTSVSYYKVGIRIL